MASWVDRLAPKRAATRPRVTLKQELRRSSSLLQARLSWAERGLHCFNWLKDEVKGVLTGVFFFGFVVVSLLFWCLSFLMVLWVGSPVGYDIDFCILLSHLFGTSDATKKTLQARAT